MPAGMELPVDFLQVEDGEFRVDLERAEVLVAEVLLHVPGIGVPADHVGRAGPAEHVGRHLLLDPCERRRLEEHVQEDDGVREKQSGKAHDARDIRAKKPQDRTPHGAGYWGISNL